MDIKGKAKAIGMTKNINPKKGLIGSALLLKDRSFYDFNLELDLLMRKKGKCGVVFRMFNKFNYYAFVINTVEGYKGIVKVENGNLTFLVKADDGGIVINDWHKIKIQALANNIRVYIYDKEQKDKASSEKVFNVDDNSLIKGTLGVFSTDLEGLYIDELKVKSNHCWTPWLPRKDIQIITNTANAFEENFKGSLAEKYTVVDIESKDNETSAFEFVRKNDEYRITQTSLIGQNRS